MSDKSDIQNMQSSRIEMHCHELCEYLNNATLLDNSIKIHIRVYRPSVTTYSTTPAIHEINSLLRDHKWTMTGLFIETKLTLGILPPCCKQEIFDFFNFAWL